MSSAKINSAKLRRIWRIGFRLILNFLKNVQSATLGITSQTALHWRFCLFFIIFFWRNLDCIYNHWEILHRGKC